MSVTAAVGVAWFESSELTFIVALSIANFPNTLLV